MKSNPGEVVFLDTKEFAARWRISVECARRKIRAKELRSYLIGRRRLVALVDVLAAEAAARIEKRTE